METHLPGGEVNPAVGARGSSEPEQRTQLRRLPVGMVTGSVTFLKAEGGPRAFLTNKTLAERGLNKSDEP